MKCICPGIAIAAMLVEVICFTPGGWCAAGKATVPVQTAAAGLPASSAVAPEPFLAMAPGAFTTNDPELAESGEKHDFQIPRTQVRNIPLSRRADGMAIAGIPIAALRLDSFRDAAGSPPDRAGTELYSRIFKEAPGAGAKALAAKPGQFFDFREAEAKASAMRAYSPPGKQTNARPDARSKHERTFDAFPAKQRKENKPRSYVSDFTDNVRIPPESANTAGLWAGVDFRFDRLGSEQSNPGAEYADSNIPLTVPAFEIKWDLSGCFEGFTHRETDAGVRAFAASSIPALWREYETGKTDPRKERFYKYGFDTDMNIAGGRNPASRTRPNR